MNKGQLNRLVFVYGIFKTSSPYCKHQGRFGRIVDTTKDSFNDNFYTIKLETGKIIYTFIQPEKIYHFKPLFKKEINIYG